MKGLKGFPTLEDVRKEAGPRGLLDPALRKPYPRNAKRKKLSGIRNGKRMKLAGLVNGINRSTKKFTNSKNFKNLGV